MIALAIVLTVVLVFSAFVCGRAIVYARSEEYKMDERIKKVTKR